MLSAFWPNSSAPLHAALDCAGAAGEGAGRGPRSGTRVFSRLAWALPAPLCFLSEGADEEGEEETLLGTFSYDIEKEPTQTFPLQVREVCAGKRPGQKRGFASKSVAEGAWMVLAGAGAQRWPRETRQALEG